MDDGPSKSSLIKYSSQDEESQDIHPNIKTLKYERISKKLQMEEAESQIDEVDEISEDSSDEEAIARQKERE